VKSTVETIDPTKVKLTVEVGLDELKPALDRASTEISKQVNIPGFRKGKVPAAILNQRIGFGPVLEQAINDSIPQFYGEAARENNLRPMAQPEVEITEIPTSATEGSLKFTAEVAVRPEIKLPELSTITVTVPDVTVDESEVNERLDALRERFGSLVGVDRPAADGDFVVIDLDAKIDGASVDSVSGISYQIGSGNMLAGLDEALTGLSTGESTTFTTTLVGGDHAGQQADVTVTATGVKERDLPEADDDFAGMASEFETIDELKNSLRDELSQAHRGQQVVDARNKLMEALVDGVEIPVPDVAVQRAVHAHLEQENRLEDDVHRAEVTEQATGELRDQILMDTLAEALDVKVSQPELVDYMIQTAQHYGMDPQQFIQLAGQSGQIPALVADVARSKAAAHALRQVTVKDEGGNVLDLTEFIGSAESDAQQAEMEAQMMAQANAMAQGGEFGTLAGESGEGSGEELAPSAADPTAIPEF
jgi:trigger factor